MKKFLLVILALMMCVLLCSCGRTLEGKTIRYTALGDFRCTATFNNGEMYFFSPVTNDSFSYELVGNDKIVFGGTITYTYEIDGNVVKFSDEFMGVSDTWFLN